MNVGDFDTAFEGISPAMVAARPDIAVSVGIAHLLAEILKRIAAIETRLTATGPPAADLGDVLSRLAETLKVVPAPRTGKARRTTANVDRSLDRLAAVGIEADLGRDELAELLKRSGREIDRMRSAGKIPKPDFRSGKSPRWRPETIRAWLATRGESK